MQFARFFVRFGRIWRHVFGRTHACTSINLLRTILSENNNIPTFQDYASGMYFHTCFDTYECGKITLCSLTVKFRAIMYPVAAGRSFGREPYCKLS